jgi:hypothetical protein
MQLKFNAQVKNYETLFGLYSPKGLDSHFFHKFIKFIHGFHQVQNQDSANFSTIVVDATSYLNNTYNIPLNYQANIGTPLNIFLKYLTKIYNIFPIPKKYNTHEVNKIFCNSSYCYNNDTSIGPAIVIGDDIENPLAQNLIQNVGLEINYLFAIFHEFSHHIQTTLSEHDEYDILEHVIDVAKNIHLEHYNNNFQSHKDYGDVENNFLESLYTNTEECYADTGSLLILRNMQISNNTYDKNSFLTIIKSVHNARIHVNYGQSKIIYKELPLFTHFTNIVSDVWMEQICSSEEKVLSLQEIHNFCNDVKRIAAARLIYLLYNSNECYKQIINSLELASYNEELNFYYIDMESENEHLGELVLNTVGDNWLKSFEENKKHLMKVNQSLSVSDYFYLATHQTNKEGKLNIIS